MKTLTFLLYILHMNLLCNISTQKNIETNISIDDSFIRNNKIKYSLVLASCDSCSPIVNKGYRIVTQITEKERKIAHQLTYNDWVRLLNDKKSDWAANLILYDIFDKDALSFYSFNNRKKWLKYFKGEDLAFWEQKLKLTRESQK